MTHPWLVNDGRYYMQYIKLAAGVDSQAPTCCCQRPVKAHESVVHWGEGRGRGDRGYYVPGPDHELEAQVQSAMHGPSQTPVATGARRGFAWAV